VAITLLAVDDSVTMRKVLEITFASPDFRVVTANSADAALQKFRTDKPDMVISDITLDPKSGYELCKAVKQLSPATPVLLLSSKQNPFDTGKGTAAQADDHMDKPFDTQQMIEKVKKMLQNRAEAPAAKPAPAGAAAPPPTGTSPAVRPATANQPTAPAAAAGAGAAPVQRAKTLIYNPPAGAPAHPAAPAASAAAKPAPGVTAPAGGVKPGPSPTPPAGLPRQRTVALGGGSAASPSPPAVTSAAPSAAAAVALNGQMAAKLEGIGLTPAQVDAVLALSREVVERVVWEVVPVLAETIIKEELARLTK
jgi:DNA-binding response OmpR family regulator